MEEDAPDVPFVTLADKVRVAENQHVTFDIKRDGAVIFDGSASGEPVPQRSGIVLVDGMEFSVVGPDLGFKDFLTAANGAGRATGSTRVRVV